MHYSNIFLFLTIFFLVEVLFGLINKMRARYRINYDANVSETYKDKARELIENDEELKKIRVIRKIIKVIGILMLTIFLGVNIVYVIFDIDFDFLLGVCHRFLFIGLLICFFLTMRSPKNVYNIIFPKLIKEYDENLIYDHNNGISLDTYQEAEFDKTNLISSEDYISGYINGLYFELSEVVAKYYDESILGSKDKYKTLFEGTFCKVSLNKYFPNDILITNFPYGKRNGLYNDNRILSGNTEFDRLFSILTIDHISALRLLTPDVTSRIVDLYNETGLSFEIKLSKFGIYFRFNTGRLFNYRVSNIEEESIIVGNFLALLDGLLKVIYNITDEVERYDV